MYLHVMLRSGGTFVDGLLFPEGLRWAQGRLWFSDIHGHQVLSAGVEDTAPAVVAQLDDRPSGLGFDTDGTLLIVSMLDRRLLAVDGDGGVSVRADLRPFGGDFCNDMVVDAVGRAYIGSRAGRPGTDDAILLALADGRVSVVASATTPNGSVITPDGALLLAETAAGRLVHFDVGEHGALSGRRVVAELDGMHLDGICLDSEGCVWAGGGQFGLLRIGPDGTLLERIDFPGRLVVSCVFGGDDRDELYVASVGEHILAKFRRIGLDRSGDGEGIRDGRIERFTLEPSSADAPITGAGIP
jgi:sugar lactone lactonase YvrE